MISSSRYYGGPDNKLSSDGTLGGEGKISNAVVIRREYYVSAGCLRTAFVVSRDFRSETIANADVSSMPSKLRHYLN